jgi:hypothetical protein
MKRLLLITVALIAVAALGTAYFAGKTFTPFEPTQSIAASSAIDCRAESSNLNALLDAKHNSPNIARATAEFERGVAECMWGRFTTADAHYQQAYKLLQG